MRLRPLVPGDDDAIRAIFRSTFVVGAPVPDFPDFDAYSSFSLDWFLTEARDEARVVDNDGEVAGYVLVCTREEELSLWQKKAGRAFLRRVVPNIVARRYPKDADKFYRDRIVDGFYLWRDGPFVRLAAHIEPHAHAHFNLARGARSALIVRDFVEHIDEMCRRRGIAAWQGEMNSKAGRRAAVLERYGAQIIDRRKNLTLSWLAGESVERLTVVREVGEIARGKSLSSLPPYPRCLCSGGTFPPEGGLM